MGGGIGDPRARLAELVAALSLGVDLGFGQPMEHVLRQCLIGLRLEQLELPAAVCTGTGTAYEQWDGRGWPGTLKAGAIPLAARIAQLAEFTEVAYRAGGVAGAAAPARRRAGRQFDPALAALLCSRAGEIFDGLDAVPAWQAVIAAEPALAVELPPG